MEQLRNEIKELKIEKQERKYKGLNIHRIVYWLIFPLVLYDYFMKLITFFVLIPLTISINRKEREYRKILLESKGGQKIDRRTIKQEQTQYTKCSYCGYETPVQFKKCSHCGAVL